MLNPAQSKYPVLFCGCMRLDTSISHHLVFPLLFKYATEGCPVDCGEPWIQEHLKVVVHRGPHISAQSPEALTVFCKEVMEKGKQGYTEVHWWANIKQAPIKNLKISPLTAVPHKSRLFCAILDLSFQLHLKEINLPSVNTETMPLSDYRAMEQMSRVLWWIVTTVAGLKMNHGPIIFAK